jgi:hypothetical protein
MAAAARSVVLNVQNGALASRWVFEGGFSKRLSGFRGYTIELCELARQGTFTYHLVAGCRNDPSTLLCERLNSCRPLIDFIISGPFD